MEQYCRFRNDFGYWLIAGGFLGEARLLEGAEAAAEGQMRRAARLAQLPPDQLDADAHHPQSAQPQSQRHQRQIRSGPKTKRRASKKKQKKTTKRTRRLGHITFFFLKHSLWLQVDCYSLKVRYDLLVEPNGVRTIGQIRT